LVPASKYNFSIEPQLITTDQANLVSGATFRNYGLATVFTSNINNIFKGAEILQFRYRIALEAQRGPSIAEKPFFNSFESALNANLIFPKLLGFLTLDRAFENSINKTILSSSILFEQNVNWKRTVFSLGLNYQFSKKQLTFQVTPSEISFIRTDFANNELSEKSKNDPYLQSIFANNLITNSRVELLYNNQSIKKNNSYFFIRWDVLELAGIIPSAIYEAFQLPKSDSGYFQMFGVRFFNYAKTYADVRFNQFIDVNNKVVYRLALGCALPFWNSDEFVPFDKRFFNGGANSIRAFLPRSLGPGAYNVEDQLDRSGDMKIEANAEYRFNIFKRYFEGALFVDAGNIWRIKEDGRAEATFKLNEFYKQLAVGTGFGFRLNLDFLVFRIDWAVPVMDPRKVLNKRFVLPNYADPGMLWEASILNFGVGYPF
jgi:outer membrane protein assembly factor BamA